MAQCPDGDQGQVVPLRVCVGPVLPDIFISDTALDPGCFQQVTPSSCGVSHQGVRLTHLREAGRASEGTPKELEMQLPLSRSPEHGRNSSSVMVLLPATRLNKGTDPVQSKEQGESREKYLGRMSQKAQLEDEEGCTHIQGHQQLLAMVRV